MTEGERNQRNEAERGTEPANPREHVRELEGHLQEIGAYLRRMGERLRLLDEQLGHLEEQDDRAVDRGRGWPTGG